jgi:hypothetical protein
MTTRITITGRTATGPGLLKRRDDELLTAGSLLLFDPTHPANPRVAGVPAATVPNIAYKEGLALTGTDVSQLTVANTLAPAHGVMERTTKGGLHGILKRVAPPGATQAFALQQNNIRAWLASNSTHAWYMSIAYAMTRDNSLAAPTYKDRFAGFLNNQQTGDALLIRPGGTTVTGAPSQGGRSIYAAPLRSTAGLQLSASAWSSRPDSPQASGSLIRWGTDEVNAGVQAGASRVIYRCYLEDLTVSGRSGAQVFALDSAICAALSGPGGRYAADTFTDPAIVS